MMSFKKLVLASAIAAVSTSSFALEAMDDSSMSATTGQDGLTITLGTQLSLNMYIHDNDGFTGAVDSGAIGIKGVSINDGNATAGNAGVRIDIDAGANVATAPVLQARVSTTTTTALTLGTVTVANSNRTSASALGANWGVTSETGTLMNLGTLRFNATNDLLVVQMGNELQGSWMRLNTTFNGGLSITGFSLNDAGGAITGGGIGGDLQIVNTAGGTNLTATVAVDANTSGLQLSLTQLGTAAGGMDVRLADLRLGNLAAAGPMVGDIEIIGLNLNGTTVTVVGH